MTIYHMDTVGPRLAFIWQGHLLQRAFWRSCCAFRLVGAENKTFWRECCPPGRWGASARVGATGPRFIWQAFYKAFWKNWCALRLTFVWQAEFTEPSGGAAARFVRQSHHAEPQLSCGRRRRSSSVRERRWDAAGFRDYRMALSIILLCVAGAAFMVLSRLSWRTWVFV